MSTETQFPGAEETAALLQQQRENWQLCGTNYTQLDAVQTRSFTVKGITVRVQFNPARITSTSAKVDAKSIAERKCFLCRDNRPAEQTDLPFGNKYAILVNPFPIMPEHFTLTHRNHIPQEILGSLNDMLLFARYLGSRYLVFYNGPRCGASAPDHLHFQAGNLGFLPVEEELEKKTGTVHQLSAVSECTAYYINDGLRKYTVLESDDSISVQAGFMRIYSAVQDAEDISDEPLMNVICYYKDGMWRVVIFHRSKHRPAMYFAEGEEKMMLSPATIDIGGVAVTPREEDFNKITSGMLETIFTEVFPDTAWEQRYLSELS